MLFERGKDPKEAMNIGRVAICKKCWDKELCQKCSWADFGWRPDVKIGETKNYCKLGYWGIPDEL